MATVKCPHCGAGNQDASEADPCWQCENILGKPATRPIHPPAAANPIVAPTQQLSPDAVKNLTPTRSADAQRTNTVILLFGVLTFAVVLVLLLVILTRK